MTKPLTRSGTPHATVSVLCPLIESMMYDLIISAKGIKLHRRSYATNKDMTLRETVRKKKHDSLHRLRRRQIFFLEKLGDFEIDARCETALGTYTLAVPVKQEWHWREYQGEATK